MIPTAAGSKPQNRCWGLDSGQGACGVGSIPQSQIRGAIQQDAAQWQGRFAAEQVARQKADAQTTTVRQDNQRLNGEVAEWRQRAAKAQLVFQSVTAEVEELRPLKAWAGHPCMVCKQPMFGSVDREMAARLMKDLGHKACVEQQGSGLGWLLAGGAALYGLSQ